MSQGRQPSVKVGGDRTTASVENGEQMDSNDNIVKVSKETKELSDLPDEILVKVFSYLEHGDKLSSRLVCKRWCRWLASSSGIRNSVVYTVKNNTGAIEPLNKSDVGFRKVTFEFLGPDSIGLNPELENWAQDIRLPDGVAKNVTSLKLKALGDNYCCAWTWTSLKSIIMKFNNLQALEIEAEILGSEVEESSQEALMMQDKELVKEKWTAIVKNLRILRLGGPTNLDQWAKILEDFAGVNNLIELKVGYIHTDLADIDEDTHEAVKERMCCMISASRETLKKLTVYCDSMEDQYLEKILIPKNLASLKFEFRCDVQLLKRCLGTLEKLEHVSFPTVFVFDDDNANVEAPLVLVAGLPRSVRSLAVKRRSRLESNFLDKLPELAHLYLRFEIVPYVTTGKKYVNLRSLCCHSSPNTSLDWVTAFPNLTKLRLAPGWGSATNYVNDLALQTIIKSMKKLRSLVLESRYNTISDYGLTGIPKKYQCMPLCNYLVETQVLREDGSEPPSEFRTGLPVCSLKWLNELIISTQGDITNVGIRFGLGFKELRRLTLKFCEPPNHPAHQLRPRITDAGMAYLGKMNPSLEYLNLDFESKSPVTHKGVDRLLGQLHRIKAHHHNLKSETFESQLHIPASQPKDDSWGKRIGHASQEIIAFLLMIIRISNPPCPFPVPFLEENSWEQGIGLVVLVIIAALLIRLLGF